MRPRWALVPFALILSGCVGAPSPADLAVASYPAAFLAEALAGDDLVVVDIGSGVAVHDYEATPSDLDRLRNADHLLLWDERLETWADRARTSLGGSAPPVYEITRLPAGEGLLDGHVDDEHADDQDEHVDDEHADDGHDDDHSDDADDEQVDDEHAGADGDEAHGDDHTDDDHDHTDEGHDHDLPYDPHTWTDPLVMRASAAALAAQMVEWYPVHAANITARAAALDARLVALDAAFAAGLADCAHDTIVTNHEAHAYLARRYDFHVLSLHGITPGAEPSPATVYEILQVIRDAGLPAVFVEEGTDPTTLTAIREETGVAVRTLATLESRPADGDYLDEQYRNLEELRFGLACR
jgi:ABC-type Zn uptake system ZnuABC Zn-binding protein ZnuA